MFKDCSGRSWQVFKPDFSWLDLVAAVAVTMVEPAHLCQLDLVFSRATVAVGKRLHDAALGHSPAMAAQPFEMRPSEARLVSPGGRRTGYQADLLVVTDRLNFAACLDG